MNCNKNDVLPVNPNMEASSKIWFITGVSGGLGKALAIEAASNGDIVIGTLRKAEQIERFNQLVPGKTHGVQLDVTQYENLQPVLDKVISEFRRIDVLVNNAGYGLFGAIEEVSLDEARKQMETNFFGALALTQAVLPIMRRQGSGHVVQISSVAGLRSSPGMGLYNASKYALEGFSEALALETADLNIQVTIVEPGPFRTEWAGPSSSRSAKIIEDYSSTAGKLINTINGYSGQQPGDPAKGAKAIIKAINDPNPPLRLPLGKIAFDGIKDKMQRLEKNLSEWEDVILDTSFDDNR
jgi:NAD(P)-dependent dehydrogenase (short-subunit alcohol dehydrogenase family)